MTRGRLFDVLVGVLVGVLGTGAATMYGIGARVAVLEVRVEDARKTLDQLRTDVGTLLLVPPVRKIP